MSERQTWYVLEDGSSADPSEVAPDAKGVLRHKDGKAVAMRGDVPRSRGVDVDVERAKAKSSAREMKPQPQGLGYLTRETGFKPEAIVPSKAGPIPVSMGSAIKPEDAESDIAALRAQYSEAFGKKAFAGWDAATLREKIAGKAD